ncbi:methyltransferase-like protein 24 isoform X1 [Rhinatrema bivittatum]|uniref:methyltransferase-like protein 24 isoform X1 n=1 Tax=Rhinatrema bivittatum TaxID=194408 RepID=UPI001126E7D4|nr:methyltransferase-like protein 24 isoform X1 [Rhinatrema bivittatum]
MGWRSLTSRASVGLLLLSCWALTLLHFLLNPSTVSRPTENLRDQSPSYTILTIHQGHQAPEGLAEEHPGPGASPSQHYQDENEPVPHSQVDLQPWAGPRESFHTEAQRFLRYISTLQLRCSVALSQALQRGHPDDPAGGPWAVCLDHMPTLALKQQQEKCLVYTFSVVKRALDFVEVMSNVGCEVHSFGLTPKKQADIWHEGQRLVLHSQVWLDWHEQQLTAFLQGQRSSSKTLRQILQELGHKKIDVLEADLASAEWKILESVLLDGTLEAVHQLILTIHLHWPGFEVAGNDATVVRYWYSLLRELETRGFLLFHSYQDIHKPRLFLHRSHFNTSSTYTLCWVNTMWMF